VRIGKKVFPDLSGGRWWRMELRSAEGPAYAVNPQPVFFNFKSLLSFAFCYAVMGFLLGWTLSAAILVNIAWHEYGHLREANRLGLRTAPMFFIPFFGGVAPILERFPSRWAEVTVTLAGPLFGWIMALICCVVGWATDSPMLLVVAFVQATVNLFNLVPINPLDGGRLVKSLAFSISARVGRAVLTVTNLLAVVAAVWFMKPVFLLIAFIGYLDLKQELAREKQHNELDGVSVSIQGSELPSELTERYRIEYRSAFRPLSSRETVLGVLGWVGLVVGLAGVMIAALAHPDVLTVMKRL
jgi:Zn-dependent protease